MKLNKNSIIVKIIASCEAPYSGATAYGQVYIPQEIVEKNKDMFSNMEMYVGDLDGKYSEDKCDIEYKNLTMAEFLNDIEQPNASRDICFDLAETIKYKLNEADKKIFVESVLSLRNIPKTKIINKNITLSADTVIENITVPKNTIIKYSIVERVQLTDDWSLKIGED